MKNIIFDLGNVLILFEPGKYVEKFVSKDKQEKFLRVIFNSLEWKNLDRGTLSYDEAKNIFKSRLEDCDEEVDKLFENNLYHVLKPIMVNVEVLNELKGKYNLYILSNFHKDSFETISSSYEFFKNFDGGIVSAYHQCLKPEEEIYRLLMDKYNLDPKETLFIDDAKENVQKAEELGIKTIHLTEYEKLREHLVNLDII